MSSAITRSYCTTKDQAAYLLEYGVAEKDLWHEGVNGQTLDRCLATYRGRPGVLVIAHDLRVFGASKKAVANVMSRLEAMNIRVVDISHPEDRTVAALMQTANIAISGSRFRDRRHARRQGRSGGLANGASQAASRDAIVPDWIVRNIVSAPELSWEARLRILGGRFSQSTLRRRYSGS